MSDDVYTYTIQGLSESNTTTDELQMNPWATLLRNGI